MRARRAVPAALALLVLAAAGPWLAPRGLDALRHVLAAHDPAALAGLRLAALPAARYAEAIDAALAAGDHDLAASVVALAQGRGVVLADDLRLRALAGPTPAERAAQAWDGFAHGTGDSAAAVSGALAADLVGYGDVRDLVREGRAWLAGRAVDPLAVGLAAAGLGLTGAVIVSAGGAAPVRVGASTLKLAARTGRLTAPLAGELAVLTRRAVDPAAFKATLAALEAGQVGAARGAARGLLTAEAATLGRLAGEFGTAAAALGPRGTMAALTLAESGRDVSRLSKLAAGFGRGTYAVIALLGGAALTLGSAAMTIAGWVVAALVWALVLTRLLARLIALALPPWGRARA